MKHFTLRVLIAFSLIFSLQANAINQSISVSTEKTSSKVLTSNQNEMNLQFHFGNINYFDVKTPKGVFTELQMPDAFSNGKIGEPNLPAQKKLIAIPFGAELHVTVNSFNIQTIDLGENGIKHALMPLQYDIPKNMDPSDVPFQYKEEIYTSKNFTESEIASVEILGVMRGVRIARITVEPIRYNPSTNQLEVYNDINVSISYENANWALTENTFRASYSPAFTIAYKTLLNIDNLYDDYPDILTFPVNMLIVANPMFTDALQPFIEWKTKMGYYLTVAYTDEIGSSSDEIKTWVHNEYNTGLANGNAPDFVVFVGDVQQVPASTTGSASGRKTDLYYASVDGDMFPEMYYGRLSATNAAQLTSQLDKILYYEKYEFATPEYLDDVTLIAGADASNNPAYGQPTINYGTENYYNTEHGYDDINVYLTNYSGCYDDERIRVSFINYTAHCAENVWANPPLSINDVNNFDNPNEYPIAVGNCCMSADFGYGECIGEAWMRAANKGGAGYIGSSPSSYWKGDMYWSVGAWPMPSSGGYTPTFEETTMGAYDGAWGDTYYCLDALVFVGNLAVSEADAQSWNLDAAPLYYWQAYNTLGDPSMMPYNTQASDNDVNHMDILPIGVNQYEVSAEPGSYVAITKDGTIHGTAYVDESGVAMVDLDPIMDAGDVSIVVTKSQYIPYMAIVQAAALEGPFLSISNYVFDNGTTAVDYGSSVSLDITIKNLGTETSDDVTITLSGDDAYCTLTSNATISVGSIAPDETITIEDAYSFDIADFVDDMYTVDFDVDIEGTSKEIWESNITFDIYAPVPAFGTYTIDDASGNNNGRIDAGETVDITIQTLNNGHAASPAGSLAVASSSSFITVNTSSVDVSAIDASGMQEVTFTITAEDNTPIGTLIDIQLDYSAEDYSATYTLQEIIGLVTEDFESGDFTSFDWQMNDHPWTIVDADEAYEGEHAAKSGSISGNQQSTLELAYSVVATGDLSFYYKVSSESGYDKLKFYIDGAVQDDWSGDVAWSQAIYSVSAGDHVFKWEYMKDGSVDGGEDCAWLDNIVFPATASSTLTAAFSVDETDPCDGTSVNFTSTSIGDVSTWSWTFEGGDPATSTEENPEVSYETAGNYDVTLVVTDADNNTAEIVKDDFITVHNCTGIDNIEAAIHLYPNPNNGNFYLDIQGMDHADMKIMNSIGRIVYQENDMTIDNSMKEIDLSNEAKGIYMIIVENNDQRIIEKVIIK